MDTAARTTVPRAGQELRPAWQACLRRPAIGPAARVGAHARRSRTPSGCRIGDRPRREPRAPPDRARRRDPAWDTFTGDLVTCDDAVLRERANRRCRATPWPTVRRPSRRGSPVAAPTPLARSDHPGSRDQERGGGGVVGCRREVTVVPREDRQDPMRHVEVEVTRVGDLQDLLGRALCDRRIDVLCRVTQCRPWHAACNERLPITRGMGQARAEPRRSRPARRRPRRYTPRPLRAGRIQLRGRAPPPRRYSAPTMQQLAPFDQ